MGQDTSTPIDPSTPPTTLTARTIPALASHLTSGRVHNIVVLTGAGISTSAGIPDFRSPSTGLYANLARLNLPYAEAVFDIAYFRQHPEPFYALAQELYPGQFRPTVAHAFIRLLHEKGLLSMHFTQNIDCLDREAGVPGEKIVEAHGSFARSSCIECREAFDGAAMRAHVAEKSIPKCEGCGGLVKPEIVFFGEALPSRFFEMRALPAQADLCIVMGTSLTVQPFGGLPGLVREEVPRVLINKEQVGGLGSRLDDVLVLGDCDEGVRMLAEACGWGEELEGLWAEVAPEEARRYVEGRKGLEGRSKDQVLEDEIEKMTKEMDRTLDLTQERVEELGGGKERGKGTVTHEAAGQDLSHVFVSQTETASQSKTPVVPVDASKDTRTPEKRGGAEG